LSGVGGKWRGAVKSENSVWEGEGEMWQMTARTPCIFQACGKKNRTHCPKKRKPKVARKLGGGNSRERKIGFGEAGNSCLFERVAADWGAKKKKWRERSYRQTRQEARLGKETNGDQSNAPQRKKHETGGGCRAKKWHHGLKREGIRNVEEGENAAKTGETSRPRLRSRA